jgi:hypothetical protein
MPVAMDDQISSAPILSRFRAALTDSYGDRLERGVLFGSHGLSARSDYDIAAFIRKPVRWFNEVVWLADLGASILMDTGAVISAKPSEPVPTMSLRRG